jgi:pimeloyl-ACP methyl ester carboxylesterase
MAHSTFLVRDVRRDNPVPGLYLPLWLKTERGEIECRLYEAGDTPKAVIWVGGVGGGWDSPAREMYPRLAEELTVEGIASLRLRYRHPQKLNEAVFDVRAGIDYLQGEGRDHIALVGHSLGGAVVIQAAAGNPDIRTIVTLAAMSYGTELVRELMPTTSLLLLHGGADTVLPASCSRVIHDRATVYKRIVVLPNAGHVLDESAEEVCRTVQNWLVDELSEQE